MNAKELPGDWATPGKAMHHFPNLVTRPSVLVLVPRQRRWRFQAFFALCTAYGHHCLTGPSGSEGCGEQQWMK